jgi:hypothetical protein
VAGDPTENRSPAGHPGIATDGAKAFAVDKPVADRHGDLGAIIGRTAALGLVVSHADLHSHHWRHAQAFGTPSIYRLHISNDGLPAVMDVDVLDTNVLVSAMLKPSKNLDLR